MAEQGRIVMPTVGATGRKGRLTSNTLHNAAYGRVSFTSYLERASDTGYTSNQRPAIYYTPSLDHTDNPQFGLSLSDSYMSQTKLHYQPHIRLDCLGPLPSIINKPRDSGFYQTRTQPRAAAVEEKTEYQTSFLHPPPLTLTVSLPGVTVGPKRETGFTEGRDLQLFTFQEKNSCSVKPRQAHSSVTKSDFKPTSCLQDTDAIPGICSQSGYTRGAIAPLAWPSSLLPSPQTKSNAPSLKTIGKKEPTGHLLNAPSNQVFPTTPLDGSHFTTHYKSTFRHHDDMEKLISGPTCPGIITTKIDNSYTRREMDRFIFRG